MTEQEALQKKADLLAELLIRHILNQPESRTCMTLPPSWLREYRAGRK